MGIKTVEARDEDMDRIFQVACDAFGRNEPMWDVMYPKHWLAEGRAKGADKMRKTNRADPCTKFIVAVDEDTGAIQGMSKWNIYAHNTFPDTERINKEVGDYYESDEERQFASAMTAIFLGLRNDAIEKSGGNLVSLDILAVDPKYQRLGVGGKLVEWGTTRADDLGVEAVVESSVFGKGLYEKNGFVFFKNVEMKSEDERWKGRSAGRFAWLVRPKRQ